MSADGTDLLRWGGLGADLSSFGSLGLGIGWPFSVVGLLESAMGLRHLSVLQYVLRWALGEFVAKTGSHKVTS
jgi:hypothetical protein